MRTPFLPVFVITLATGVMANMHYRHHHEPLHELETVLNLDDDSFDTALASWNRMDEFKSAIWLLWFHTSSDTTHIDGPMPSTSDGVHVASFAMRRSSRTMRRLGVQIIPSFACLNYSRQKLYRYPEPFKEGDTNGNLSSSIVVIHPIPLWGMIYPNPNQFGCVGNDNSTGIGHCNSR